LIYSLPYIACPSLCATFIAYDSYHMWELQQSNTSVAHLTSTIGNFLSKARARAPRIDHGRHWHCHSPSVSNSPLQLRDAIQRGGRTYSLIKSTAVDDRRATHLRYATSFRCPFGTVYTARPQLHDSYARRPRPPLERAALPMNMAMHECRQCSASGTGLGQHSRIGPRPDYNCMRYGVGRTREALVPRS
jgi:hypothetical protein